MTTLLMTQCDGSACMGVSPDCGPDCPYNRIRAMRASDPASFPKFHARAQTGGPGTELRGLLASLGITEPPNCDCSARMRQMDEWGVHGCRVNADQIAGWLREGQGEWGWADKLKAGALALATGLAFKLNWADPFPGLIDEAIRRAERILPMAVVPARQKFDLGDGRHTFVDAPGHAESVAAMLTKRTVQAVPRNPMLTFGQAKETLIPGAALADSQDGTHFNASMIDYHGRRLLCYRTGRNGSQIHICELNGQMFPGPSTRLELTHERAIDGREDPRLFIHAGRLHVSYGGYNGKIGQKEPSVASCLYARLTDDLRVEQIYYPDFKSRAAWEKNWTWFSWSGELFAVYDVVPHTVLHVVHDRAELFQRVAWVPNWKGGMLRGGASPILVDEEFWCFFHGAVEPGGWTPYGIAQRRMYSIGVYTFQADAPFKPVRYTPDPILWADPSAHPAGFWCDAVFPAGAVLDGDRWLVSAGVMDAWTAIYEFSKAKVEKGMVPA